MRKDDGRVTDGSDRSQPIIVPRGLRTLQRRPARSRSVRDHLANSRVLVSCVHPVTFSASAAHIRGPRSTALRRCGRWQRCAAAWDRRSHDERSDACWQREARRWPCAFGPLLCSHRPPRHTGLAARTRKRKSLLTSAAGFTRLVHTVGLTWALFSF